MRLDQFPGLDRRWTHLFRASPDGSIGGVLEIGLGVSKETEAMKTARNRWVGARGEEEGPRKIGPRDVVPIWGRNKTNPGNDRSTTVAKRRKEEEAEN